MAQTNTPYVIGIAGGSASGKTSFLRNLQENLPSGSVSIVSQDNYYRPKEEQEEDEIGEINFDLPTSINQIHFYKDVMRLINGESITQKEYTFNNPSAEPSLIKVDPAPLIIVEGLFVFHYPEIRELLNLRVYIDVREELKLKRRIKRDGTERGYDRQTVLYQWHNHVMPSFKKFLKPYRDDSHLIITNNHTFDKGLEVLSDHLKLKVPVVDSVQRV
jgi:uridine kinase